MTRSLLTAALVCLAGGPLPAQAQGRTTSTGVNGFAVLRIVGEGVSLSDRFGKGSGVDVDRYVNRADCYLYLNGKQGQRCKAGSTDGTGTADVVTTTDGAAASDTAAEADAPRADTTAAAEPQSPSDDCPETCAREGDFYCCEGLFHSCEGGVLKQVEPCEPADCSGGGYCGQGCPSCPAGQTCSSDGECAGGAQKPGDKADDGDGTAADAGTEDPLASDDAAFIVVVSAKAMSTAGVGYDHFGVAFGTSCTETFPETDSDNCKALPSYPYQSWNDWAKEIKVTVRMKDFLGTTKDCDGSGGEKRLYFYGGYKDLYTNDRRNDLSEVVFTLDYSAPTKPSLDEVVPGENNLKVRWNKSDDATAKYRIYYAKTEFTTDTLEEDNVQATGSIDYLDDGFQLKGLSNGQAYFVGVVATDAAGNESALCTPATDLLEGIPMLVDDFWELYKGSGGKEEGGYCFVATAAWGSPLSPAVTSLREYRDEHLLANEGGQALVGLYYRVGPRAASAIADSEPLRLVSRVLLVPLVVVALLVLGLPAWGPLAALCGAFLARKGLCRRRARGSGEVAR